MIFALSLKSLSPRPAIVDLGKRKAFCRALGKVNRVAVRHEDCLGFRVYAAAIGDRLKAELRTRCRQFFKNLLPPDDRVFFPLPRFPL